VRVLPYWLLFAVFAVGALLNTDNRSPGGRPSILFPIALIGLALMIGLRFEVGGDWFAYTEMLERTRYSGLVGALRQGDSGYGLLNWLAAQLDLGIWAVNLVCASIFVWGLGKLARLQSNPWLAVLIAVPYMIIVVAMGYTRQSAALGLLMAAIAAFASGSLGGYFRMVILAVTFHRTAIVFLPFGQLSVSRNKILVGLLSVAMAAALYIAFVSQSIDKLVSGYIDASYKSEGAAIRVAMGVPPAIFYLAFRQRFRLERDLQRLYTNLSIAVFVVVLGLLTVSSSTVIDRLALYLLPLQIVVLAQFPTIFSGTRASSLALTLGVVTYLAVIQFVWLNFATNVESWLPYQLYGFA
jgi:hypothetical protein